VPCEWAGGWSKGEEGAVENDLGEGVVGGERWMKVKCPRVGPLVRPREGLESWAEV